MSGRHYAPRYSGPPIFLILLGFFLLFKFGFFWWLLPLAFFFIFMAKGRHYMMSDGYDRRERAEHWSHGLRHGPHHRDHDRRDHRDHHPRFHGPWWGCHPRDDHDDFNGDPRKRHEAPDKRKNDEREPRYVQTADGEWLEVVPAPDDDGPTYV